MPLKNDRGQLLDKERVSWDEKNDGSFAQKRRVTFIKTTGRFFSTDGSFFKEQVQGKNRRWLNAARQTFFTA